jgi:hypothetical protein
MLDSTAKVIETMQHGPNTWETLRVPVSAEIEDKIFCAGKNVLTVAMKSV